MSSACFYQWRSKFGGMDASFMKRMKELEDGNRRLKKMYAEEKPKLPARPLKKSGEAILQYAASIRIACEVFSCCV